MTKPQLILPFVAACVLALAGCNYNSYVYRIDVPQGNLITEEMAEQVRTGMTREQVHFLLGEALVQSDFHMNRWDYVYYFNPRRGKVQLRKMTVFFDKEAKVEKIVSDPLPNETQADEAILGAQIDLKKNTKE